MKPKLHTLAYKALNGLAHLADFILHGYNASATEALKFLKQAKFILILEPLY